MLENMKYYWRARKEIRATGYLRKYANTMESDLNPEKRHEEPRIQATFYFSEGHLLLKNENLSSSCPAISTDVPEASLATPPYFPLLPPNLQRYIPYRQRAAVSRFELIVLPLLRDCVRVHRSTSLMRSSVLFQQCPACLAHLILIVFMIGGKWLYSSCFVGCSLQDLFNIARSILV